MNNPYYYPYPSKRNAVYAKNGMVATSQPLAAQAGLEILKKGGNAIDAAIATAACLTVVNPASNGIGGDAFAIVSTNNKLYGLNASGPSPKNISIEAVKALGFTQMPKFGFIPVTVPGAPSAWSELSKMGKLPLEETLRPAINYARNGFAVSPTVAKNWQTAYDIYKSQFTSQEFSHWFETFTKDNKTPQPGEIFYLPDHAKTLELIASTNAQAFYNGVLTDKIIDFSNKYQGFLTKEDFQNYNPQWVDPISIKYRGYDVWELPPNGQGLVALMGLNILQGFTFTSKDNPDTVHKQIEALKLAFADGLEFITDEKEMAVKTADFLSENYGVMQRARITSQAQTPKPIKPNRNGTVYLATADNEGNMVSYIQSNYMGFGSGLVVPNTGISLQNRGHTFSLNPNHANSLAPNKKTYHTIIPGFLTKDNQAIGPFGVMGGFMQPQGHIQVIMNTLDFNLNPQAALDAPRWQWIKDKDINIEQSMANHIIQELALKGHRIQVEYDSGSFGRGQIIWRDPNTKVLIGGTESRADGSIACW